MNEGRHQWRPFSVAYQSCSINQTVILSGAFSSRSEVNGQSKDPGKVSAIGARQGIFSTTPGA
jgi:hypothetical protein